MTNCGASSPSSHRPVYLPDLPFARFWRDKQDENSRSRRSVNVVIISIGPARRRREMRSSEAQVFRSAFSRRSLMTRAGFWREGSLYRIHESSALTLVV